MLNTRIYITKITENIYKSVLAKPADKLFKALQQMPNFGFNSRDNIPSRCSMYSELDLQEFWESTNLWILTLFLNHFNIFCISKICKHILALKVFPLIYVQINPNHMGLFLGSGRCGQCLF